MGVVAVGVGLGGVLVCSHVHHVSVFHVFTYVLIQHMFHFTYVIHTFPTLPLQPTLPMHTNPPLPAPSYYAEHIARAGYIGLVMSGCPEYSAPYGSSEAVYGTNAFAYGFPRQGGDPIVCDMGTTAEAYYGLMTVKVWVGMVWVVWVEWVVWHGVG